MERAQQNVEAQHAEDLMMANVALRAAVEQGITGAGKPKKNLSLERISVENKVKIALDNVDTRKEKNCTDFKQGQVKAAELDNAAAAIEEDNDAQKQDTELGVDLQAKHDAAGLQLDALRKQITDLSLQVASAPDVAHLAEIRTSLTESMKTMNKAAVKDFQDTLRQVNMAHVATMRTGGRIHGASARKAAVAAQPKPANHLVLFHIGSQDHNISDSVFETKGGLRASATATSSEKNLANVENHSQVKKGLKMNARAIKNGQEHLAHEIVGSKQLCNRFRELMQTACSPELFSKVPLPKAEWCTQVYKFEVITCNESFVFDGWGHMGMIECRLILSGACVFAGVPSGCIAGDTFFDKRATVAQMPASELESTIRSRGWIVSFNEKGL